MTKGFEMGLLKKLVRNGSVLLGAALIATSAAATPSGPGEPTGGGGLGGPGTVPVPVSEPPTWLLLTVGVTGLVLAVRAKRKR